MDDVTRAWAQYGETEIVPGRLAGVTRRLGRSLPNNLNIPAHILLRWDTITCKASVIYMVIHLPW